MTKANISVRIADWNKDKDQLQQIRHTVFIEEQKVPEEMEWDEFDSSSTHFLVTHNEKVIATARLIDDGKIGRMAVLAQYRNQGIGSQLLAKVLQHARDNRMTKVYLHAQVTAIHFYERQEFIAQGDIFYEANIPHREMCRKLC